MFGFCFGYLVVSGNIDNIDVDDGNNDCCCIDGHLMIVLSLHRAILCQQDPTVINGCIILAIGNSIIGTMV